MQIHVFISCVFSECLDYVLYIILVMYCAPHNTFVVRNPCRVLPEFA